MMKNGPQIASRYDFDIDDLIFHIPTNKIFCVTKKELNATTQKLVVSGYNDSEKIKDEPLENFSVDIDFYRNHPEKLKRE